MEISSEDQLQKVMGDIAEEVIYDVSKQALELLKKYIIRDVYNHHGNNKVYYNDSAVPTLEFLYSWKLGNIVKAMTSITRELFQDWEWMKFDENSFLHGSKYNKTHAHDQRENLAEILNKNKVTSNLWIAVEVRPYWDNWMTDIFDNGQLDKWFTKALTSRGVIV